MGDVIRYSIKKYLFFLIVIMTGILAFLILMGWHARNTYFDERDIRVKVNQLIYQLEVQPTSKASAVSFEFPYCVIGYDGLVQISTIMKYQTGEKIDLHTLGGAKCYIVPITGVRHQERILYVDCEDYRSSFATSKFLFLVDIALVLWLVFLLVVLHMHKMLKRDVIEPIRQLHDATKDILSGNFNTGVRYDYDSEIGSLCHDFERMRGELEESNVRENQLREKIHVMYASISHDLKTPLAIMNGYLEGILYDVVHDPKEMKEYANRILEKSWVLNKMIDDILEHSKAEMNQLSIVKQEVYARDFFESLLVRYQSEAQQRDFRLSYQLPENVIILLDPVRIAEIFENLIGNSIKYGGKSVEIEVTFDMQIDTEQILLVYVKDNGPGIDAADIPFVFDMFYRGNRARTHDIPGSGLGLHISKYIIEQHGGRIECDSIIGVGTTMVFSIPLNGCCPLKAL